MLNKNERTISREIKKGLTKNVTTDLIEIEVYSADVSHNEYIKNLEAKGQDLKIGSDIKLI